jgi:hypothetical protein
MRLRVRMLLFAVAAALTIVAQTRAGGCSGGVCATCPTVSSNAPAAVAICRCGERSRHRLIGRIVRGAGRAAKFVASGLHRSAGR